MTERVAILGGGVAGMSAAHELVERGFQVAVYEARGIPGGKARSMPVPKSDAYGRKPLPGEHGFRFFPGFYEHLPDTMKRIPHGKKTVFDNLVATRRGQLARVGKRPLYLPAHCVLTPADLLTTIGFFFAEDLGLGPRELKHYFEKLLVLLTSCHQRRLHEYEHVDWWQFISAESRGEAYQKLCAEGVSRAFVACKPHDMSTRTCGYTLLQLLFDLARPGAQMDRVLNGPTNDVWIGPWLTYLKDRGVDYHLDARVTQFHCADGRMAGVTVVEEGAPRRVEADYFIAALPVEIMANLVTADMIGLEPGLGRLGNLKVAWMNGIQFYLARDVPLVHGHTLYMDSPWALTSVSQQQFWPTFKLAECGNGKVRGVLSVDISDWETPGRSGKRAKECATPEEIKNEVWDQLKAHLNVVGRTVLDDDNLVDWFLDEDIVLPNPANVPTNLEPLLTNTVGSWHDRPEAITRIPNLFLAADYVRTHTDLATMEGANEAARRAVNGILRASGSGQPRCQVWPLQEPWLFAPLRWYDALRYRKKKPHNPALIRLAMLLFVPSWQVLHLGCQAWRFLRRLVRA